MSEKTYTLEQAAGKFGKTPEQFKKLAKENGIKELREGSNILYRVEDIDALGQARAEESDDTVLNIEDSMVGSNDESSLLDLEPLDQKDDDDEELEIDADMSSMVELTEADTRSGISDSDDEDDEDQAEDSVISLADSLPDDLSGMDSELGSGSASGSGAKINADEDIDADSAEGSGSGLLDLSLQADDSQFGAVLDDILPGGEGGEAEDEFSDFDDDDVPSSGDEFTAAAAAAADDDDEEVEKPEPEQYSAPKPTSTAPTAAAPAATYRMPSEDPSSGIFGVMMLLPFIATVFAAIVLVSGFRGVTPSLMAPIKDHFLYVVAGLGALTLILGIVGAVSGSEKSEKAAKQAKPKKEKKPKKAKKKK